MNERDLWWKIVIIGVLVALAFASVNPIDEKMKFGIDLHGGYSLLYEIDDTGLDGADKQGLSERVMRVLRERVDPKGVFNLVWRPVGHNRLEIQMPRPSDDIVEARKQFETLQEDVQHTVLHRSHVLRAVSKPPAERPAAVASLEHGIAARKPLLDAVAVAYDAHKQMQADYEARVKALEQDNLDRAQIFGAMRLAPAERPAMFETMTGAVPTRRELLEEAAEAWDELEAARSAASASQPADTTSQPADDRARRITEKNEAFEAVVKKVLAANVDPNSLTEGATIDKVVELDEKLDAAIVDVLSVNIDTGMLQAALDPDAAKEFRETEIQQLKTKFPDLSPLIDGLVDANTELQRNRRGEGRLEDPADLQRLLKGAGVLEFRILADPAEMRADPNKFAPYIEALKARGPRRLPGEEEYQWFEVEEPDGQQGFFRITDIARNFQAQKQELPVIAEQFGDKYYVLAHIGGGYTLTHRPGEEDWSLKRSQFSRDESGRPAIGFTLDERGGSRFAVLTRLYTKRQLCIFLDDYAISHAIIQSVIRTSGIIHGSFTPQEVQDMVKKLNAGSLPKKLKDPPISIRSIGPSLGEANRTAGLTAAKYGAIFVGIFMLLYYFYAGGIAVIAVGMNILFIGAMMSTLGATLTLPGIAGLVLAIGMAVDANVLINERIREELARGTAMRMAVKLGYERAFRAILDSNVTTVLTCVILYFLGSEEIKGFGLTLGIGVFINIFTAYFITRIFFELMCMFPVPKEVFRYPIYAAVIIAAVGAAFYGGGYGLSEPEMRDQSVLMLFGRVLAMVAGAIAVLVLLMRIARLIHSGFQRGGKPRIPMLRLIGSPKVNWVGKRYFFFAFSAIMVGGGLFVFFSMDRNNLYDIEFLGGTAAQIDIKADSDINDIPDSVDRQTEVFKRLAESGKALKKDGIGMASATVSQDASGAFVLNTPGIPAARVEPIIKSVLDKKLANVGGVQYDDPAAESMTIRVKPESELGGTKIDLAAMKRFKVEFGERFASAGDALENAQVQSIEIVGAEAEEGSSFEVVTRETNKEIVVAGIMDTLSSDIDIQPKLGFKLDHNAQLGSVPYFPISSEKPKELGITGLDDAQARAMDLQGWKGGVAIVLNDVKPPQEIDVLRKRLKAMRLQPGFENVGWRESEVFGLASAGGSRYTRVAVVVADENYPLEDEKGGLSPAWVEDLAEPEVELLQAALQRQTSLSQITQFDNQVSSEAQLDAYIALALSWLVIIIYVWFRFGNIRWGLAAVAALIHDVFIAAGCIALTYYVADTALGKALMLEKFRIDLAMVAALLTVIGYSVNDTIVVFDRIRENRGRLSDVTPQMINDSVSQTLSRTLLTMLTSLVSVLTMYIFGGRGIHGFNFVLFIGLAIGTYSSIGIASQLLVRRRDLAAAKAAG
ncbi:MAG: protein translocase subunit SecD [Planctomycetota bacterium]